MLVFDRLEPDMSTEIILDLLEILLCEIFQIYVVLRSISLIQDIKILEDIPKLFSIYFFIILVFASISFY